MGAIIPPGRVPTTFREFTYAATGAEATAVDGSSDFTLTFGALHGAMPNTAYNATVTGGGGAAGYVFDVVLADNTTTSIHVKCMAKLVAADVLQVSLRMRK